jgi:hypothetical protein
MFQARASHSNSGGSYRLAHNMRAHGIDISAAESGLFKRDAFHPRGLSLAMSDRRT